MMVGFPPFFERDRAGIYEKILRGKIYWPKEMDRLSKELVKAFLHPDRSKRLGNLIGGSQMSWTILGSEALTGTLWSGKNPGTFFVVVLIYPLVSSDCGWSRRLSFPMYHHWMKRGIFSPFPLPPAEDIQG